MKTISHFYRLLEHFDWVEIACAQKNIAPVSQVTYITAMFNV